MGSAVIHAAATRQPKAAAPQREIDEHYGRLYALAPDQIKRVDKEMPMNPPDPTPERPRDIIDDVEDMCGQKGSIPPGPPCGHGWQTARDPEVESARIWQVQLAFFPTKPRELCERLGLNWLAACQLHADGWLSFDPRNVVALNEAQEAEMQVVGPLVAAGCDAELLARLLHGLRRPYQYRPGSIYLDWAAARWRLLPVAKEPDPPQVFADWLGSLKESADRQQLEDIASDVAAALKSLPQDEPEPEQT
jgi:hypothetical protein